jgi:hypothetical protein
MEIVTLRRQTATTGNDRTVKLWDTATGREVFTLRGHTAAVDALAFSPDGRRIVSCDIENTARVWDATPLPAKVLRAGSTLSAEESGTPGAQGPCRCRRDRADAEGATVGSDTFFGSQFLAPVYLNVMTWVFAAQITYGTPTSTTSFQSFGGETNNVSVFGLSVKFNSVDPGTIDNFSVFGFTLPGSLSGTLFAPVESFVALSSAQLL